MNHHIHHNYDRIQLAILLILSAAAITAIISNYNITIEYNELADKHNTLLDAYQDTVPYKSYLWALQNQKVVVIGGAQIDQYNISFEHSCGVTGYSSDECRAWTSEQNDLHIVTNRTIDEQIESCVHEQLHNLIELPDDKEEERIVEELDDKVSTAVCDALAQRLSE